MPIKDSTIEGLGPRKKIFEETKWIEYILCYGCGIGAFQPIVAADVKELCLRGTCSTATIGGDTGFCSVMSNCLCLTEQCAMPPAEGTPPCICCTKKFGEDRTTGTKYDKLTPLDIKQVMDPEQTIWLTYVFCMGCGLNKMKGPLVQAQFKQICCQGSEGMEGLSVDDTYCSQMATELCIWSECSMPPHPGNPKCAICTWKMNKDHSAA